MAEKLITFLMMRERSFISDVDLIGGDVPPTFDAFFPIDWDASPTFDQLLHFDLALDFSFATQSHLISSEIFQKFIHLGIDRLPLFETLNLSSWQAKQTCCALAYSAALTCC